MFFPSNRSYQLEIALAFAVLLHNSNSWAISGGAATAAGARAPHHTVVGTVWPASPDLVEPCTAVLVCSNVILTAGHCLNMQMAPGVADEKYLTLEVDMNTVAGPGGVAAPTRFQRLKAEFGRAQNTTRRIDNTSISYGESHAVPIPGPVLPITVGLAMAKLTTPLPATLTYPNLVPQNFTFAQDPNPNLFVAPTREAPNADFLNPGAAATQGLISGYGRSGINDAGAGIMRNGNQRFLSWVEPRTGNPQGRTAPAAGSRNGFLLQFAHSSAGSNAHGCPGDSGGPVFVSSGGSDRLAGIREMVSDQRCAGNPAAGPGHYDNYVSLIYTRNRHFIRNYMLANCDDRRVIDVDTGANTVRPMAGSEESSNTDEDLSYDDYFNTEEWVPAWECWMRQIWDYDPQAGFQPTTCFPETPTPSPSPEITPTDSPEPTPSFEPTSEPTTTPEAWFTPDSLVISIPEPTLTTLRFEMPTDTPVTEYSHPATDFPTPKQTD